MKPSIKAWDKVSNQSATLMKNKHKLHVSKNDNDSEANLIVDKGKNISLDTNPATNIIHSTEQNTQNIEAGQANLSQSTTISTDNTSSMEARNTSTAIAPVSNADWAVTIPTEHHSSSLKYWLGGTLALGGIVAAASGGGGGSSQSSGVTTVNHPPVANNDTATAHMNKSVIIDVLSNDTDADKDTLSVTSATPQHGAVKLNTDGTLTYTPSANYSGEDTITYTIDDGHGGTASTTVSVTVNSATSTVNVSDIDGDGKPEVSGTTAPNATVTVIMSDNSTVITTADASGTFSVESPTVQTSGLITATATDLNGNVSTSQVNYHDTTPPARAEVTINTAAKLVGTAEAGSTVIIADLSGNHTVTTQTDASGNWSINPNPLLEAVYFYENTVVAKDAAGNTSLPLTIPGLIIEPPAPPTIININADNTGTEVALQPYQGTTSNNGVTNDNTLVLHGMGRVGATIAVYDGIYKVATTTVDTSGNWTATTSKLSDGEHDLKVTQTIGSLETVPTGVFAVYVDTAAPATPTSAGTIIDDKGTVQGALIAGDTTDDDTPTFKGTGVAGDVVKIYDGDKVIASAVVNASGNYFVTPTTPLADGTHSFTTTETDSAGNESGHSPSTVITVTTADDFIPVHHWTGVGGDVTIISASPDFEYSNTAHLQAGVTYTLGEGERSNNLTMSSTTAGQFDDGSGVLVPVSVDATGLITFHGTVAEGGDWHYKEITHDGTSVVLAQVDEKWTDVMNATTSDSIDSIHGYQFPSPVFALTSPNSATILPTSGTETLYTVPTMNYGDKDDYDTVKVVLDFDNHTWQWFDIKGTVTGTDTFTLSSDGTQMLSDDGSGDTAKVSLKTVGNFCLVTDDETYVHTSSSGVSTTDHYHSVGVFALEPLTYTYTIA